MEVFKPARHRGSERAISTFLIAGAALLFATNLAFAWPGIMTWDSNDQLRQAMTGRYDSWFPPIMAVLWRQLLHVAPWGTGLLALHLAVWWGALLAIALTLAAAGKRIAAWLVLASGALPDMVLMNSFVLKDVGFSAALLAAFAIAFAFRARARRVPFAGWAAIVVLLGYAALVRQNGAAAVGPVICYAAASQRLARPVWLVIVSAAVCAVAIGASGPIDRRVFHAADFKPKRSLILFDVTGIAHWARDPGVFRKTPNPPLAVIDRCYSPALWDDLGFQPCNAILEPGYIPARSLLLAIASHPVAYAQHRLAHWNRELFFWAPVDHWHFIDVNRRPGVPHAFNEQGDQRALAVISNLPPFAPALAVALLAVLLGMMAGRDRHGGPLMEGAFFLAVSSVFYALSFLLVGVANMYRYYEPVLAGCAICLILYFAAASAQQRAVAARRLGVTAGVVLAVTTVARLAL